MTTDIQTPWLVMESGNMYRLAVGEPEEDIKVITADEVAAVLAQTGIGWIGTKEGPFINTAYIVEIRDRK